MSSAAPFTFTEKQLPATHAMSALAAPPPRHESGCGGARHCKHVHMRRRGALFAGVVALITLFVVAALALVDPSSVLGVLGVGGSGGWTDGTLLRRQIDNGGSGSGGGNGDSPFVRNKLYLIVLFVGLLLCLVAAIMLAAWCCRGSFQNPLCCPCYTCAACGGLACIECISCGLCAEAADQAF